MTRTLCIVALLASLVSMPIGASAFCQTQQDERLARILETISKTSEEGLKVIDRIQGMRPEVNDKQSTKTLTEVVEDYAFNKAGYNIGVIGWAASRKEILPPERLGRWRIVFYYRDWAKQYQTAEWEYNEDTNRLYPFETDNAPGFWSAESPQPKKRKS
jgi:hypothetical protein